MIENPVFLKEIKTKMRSRQTPAVQMAIAAIILLGLLWGYYNAIVYLVRSGGTPAARDLWNVGVVVQALLIWLLAPSLAANAITQEKEQQTWDMMIFTRLTPGEIVFGKLAARLLPAAGLLAAFFPFMLLCYARSNLTPLDFVATYVNLGVWIVFLVTVSLFMSWAFRRTSAAIAMSYIVLFVLAIGTWLIEATIRGGAMNGQDTPVLWLNPVRITAALIEPREDAQAGSVLAFSLLTFTGITVFLLWRMLSRFRAFSVE